MSLVWIGIKAFYYIYFLKIILINNQINTFNKWIKIKEKKSAYSILQGQRKHLCLDTWFHLLYY